MYCFDLFSQIIFQILNFFFQNRAVYELWVDEISHRVHTIALVTALLCARRIVQKKVDEEKRIEEEKELEEKRRLQMEQERKQREEVRGNL